MRGLNFTMLTKRISGRLSILTLLILCVGTFSSCQKEGEEFPDEVTFRFLVQDDLGNTITGAKVGFFDNEGAYQNAVNNNDISGATDTLTTTGSLDSVSLEGGKEHWVYIQYFDNIRNMLLSNLGISSQIDKLQKSSEVIAKLFIGPQTGNVTFWTFPGNYLPVRISCGPMSDTLFTNVTVAPTGPGDPNTSNFTMPSGIYPYYAVSDNGCVWTGQVTVNKGGFHPIQLSPCIRGRITFVAPSYNAAHGPITVALDNNDFLGALNGPGSYSCLSATSSAAGSGGGDFITVTRDQNNYTYIAKSQDNACVWTGSFSINSDTCLVINLPTCP